MPPLPDEERLLTVFADIHYYFSPPTPRPLHHRFDKGSYLYIYHDATRDTSRIEVANNPGTEEQDVFNGSLASIGLRHSYKFPTLVTLTVDPRENHAAGPSPPPPPGPKGHEWRLPSADPRDDGNFLFRLHTLDVYFWSLDDANFFLSTVKAILSPQQMDLMEDTQAQDEHQEPMSPVVQQLESVALSDPAYHNGQTRNSRNDQATTVPPPPPPQPESIRETPEPSSSSPPVQVAQTFAPLAYNPAAPPAPEKIAHREKTPPPVDGAEGTGLNAATTAPYGQSFGPPPAQHYTSPPPATHSMGPGAVQYGYGSPPPSAGLPHNASVSSITSPPSHSLSFAPPPTDPSATTSTPMTFAPPPVQNQVPQQQAQDQPLHSPGFGLPSPATQILGGPIPHQPLAHIQPQYPDYLYNHQSPPPGSPGYAQHQSHAHGQYSNYTYAQQPQHQQQAYGHYNHSGLGDTSIHNQVYRPTEAEAHSHVKPGSGGVKPGKFEERADRVEKGVNRFLKKLEKRL